MANGWSRLLAEPQWCHGRGRFPIPAYSEYLPPPWVGVKPTGEDLRIDPSDEYGWSITEYEQAHELKPGLNLIAREILKEVVALSRGLPTPQIGKKMLEGNPYWPHELAERSPHLTHEKHLILSSLSLSRTQDDKGRVRWTLFGASEQGPERPFWKSFYTAPGVERPASEAIQFFQRLLTAVHGESIGDLRKSGFRVASDMDELLPSWTTPLRWKRGAKDVRFLLTFQPFAELDASIQKAYFDGKLHLMPCPASLTFWGSQRFKKLSAQLPFAMQIPMLHLFPRYNNPNGIRIPQTGWLDPEKSPSSRDQYSRSHRFQRIERTADETVELPRPDPVTGVLFSTKSDDLSLYNKPIARNVQLWSSEYELFLDGPRSDRKKIEFAKQRVHEGGRYGYRFQFPPMRVGTWEIYWQLPLIAFPNPTPLQPDIAWDGPSGYLTAYGTDAPDLANPVELWPRLLKRPGHYEGVELFINQYHPHRFADALNVRAVLDFSAMLGPMPRSFANELLAVPKSVDFIEWVERLPNIQNVIWNSIGSPVEVGEPLTLHRSCTRAFETRYWKTIRSLAHGRFVNKSNADCYQDQESDDGRRKRTPKKKRPKRDLESLGDELLRRHYRAILAAEMDHKAWAGEHPFFWRTDFDFPQWQGWAKNQDRSTHERNLLIRIPGRDSSRAVILADHYDTAYMHDCYYTDIGGTGARLAACGADDNHSATAMLLMACPILLELSKAGKLECDIWLVHLTGEEFPSDCMGARHLAQAIVERSLKVIEPDGRSHNLSKVKVEGVMVADMIAHQNLKRPGVFQIAPGEGRGSAKLALAAHSATLAWNALAQEKNQRGARLKAGAGERVRSIDEMPVIARLPELIGEVRPEWEPRSTLFNTDAQIFSDAGIPVILFMEDYDINRTGYHDTHDTMLNIDLDYGAAFAAVAIETAARVARFVGG